MQAEIHPFTNTHYSAARTLWEVTEGVGLNDADERLPIERFLERNPGLSKVATIEGRVVGTILAGHDGRRGFIHHLAVDPSARRMGVAQALVRQAVRALESEGITRCHVLVYADNVAGRAFWESAGAELRDVFAIYLLTAPGPRANASAARD
jgi:putative acetyltransferase